MYELCTVLYLPGCCVVVSVLMGVAVGVVADCDSLSVETTHTDYTQHHNIIGASLSEPHIDHDNGPHMRNTLPEIEDIRLQFPHTN